MTSEFIPGLLQSFSQLLDDSDDYNVIIKIGINPNIKEFHAHSNILRARSLYFKSALSRNWTTKKDDMINFTKPNISPTVFEMIIKYMYTGTLDLKEKVGSDIFDLLVASDELLIEELVTFLQKYLIENQTEWMEKNFVKVLHTVFQLESCKQLQNYCLETICENPKPFFNSPNFPTLEKSILLGLIQREDLQIDESDLWNYLIKWGIVQTTELRGKNTTNLSDWNEKNFLDLKNTLSQLILHVRFFEITSKDFYNMIWPYKKLLPETLIEDILSFHMAETEPAEQNKLFPRHEKIAVDSKIIKSKHATILANWIQRKEANARIPKDKKYNFNLIYRGSRDGYNIDTIRSKCSGQGACILIIKIKENGTIIGGYNPNGWRYIHPDQDCILRSDYDWIDTTESFIFSLGNNNDLKNIKISRVIHSSCATYECNYDNYQLNFGNSDLFIENNTGTCHKRHYESDILDTNNFLIEEMEIYNFTITKR